MSRLLPAVLMARRNITRTKVRSGLAALGIVIGVVTIASLGMLGATLRQEATGNLGDIGSQVVVSPAQDADTDIITDRQFRNIERATRGAEVTPVIGSIEELSFGRETRPVQVYHFPSPPPGYEAVDGEIPEPLRGDALVGVGVADQLGIEPGNTITVNRSTYRVRAIVEAGGGFFNPVAPDNAVVLPREGREEYSQVLVNAESGQAANESAVAIRNAINGPRGKTVEVRELSEQIDAINQFFSFLNAFLVGLGSISLVVAGISILNIMLMSTVERREEIGVLRAVGFQKRDVLKVMLTEAALLGLAGGILGAFLSLGVGALVAHFALRDATAVLVADNLKFLALGVAFGIGTSVLSGLYPAWKAANEHPVEALRS